ncbi:metallophosphoesterase [Niastella sp. OAS944]|uniref:metallophosphoesterase n=1 Tax=Niastella sp. OAS944 TaxID=2664089 RepID=UPI003499F317|nr:hypothetical protein [Chitinophagaceae bacterium OAS944]
MLKKLSILLFIYGCYFTVAGQQEAPKLSTPGSYTWVWLPDPQTYQKFGRNQPLFETMIQWIKDQRQKLNIQLVFCTGDLVEQNNILQPDSVNGDQTSLEQWRAVSNAFNKLNGVLPYILCTGNHDYGIKSAENRYSQFNSYFPPQGNPLMSSLLVEMAPNAAGVKTLENACYEWRSPTGQLFLLFSLEFAPRAAILAWTKQVAARPVYRDHIAIVITHSYLNSTGERIEKENYAVADASYGETIYKEVIKPSGNIRFVFSGHIGNSDEHRDQVGYRLDTNVAKKEIHQVVFNAQREGGGWHGNGGDGWLRILEFLPDKRTIKVYTFSPFFYISPATRHLAWRRESYDQFELRY